MKDIPSFTHLSDSQIRDEVARSVGSERASTAHLIAVLAEYDRRRLYLADGFKSLFLYCVDGLHLSECASFTRIRAARASRQWPAVLRALRDGSVTLTAISLLAPHFTDANCEALLAEARHQRKSDVERIVARLAPKPDAPSLVRRIPSPSIGSPTAAALHAPRPSQPQAALPSQLHPAQPPQPQPAQQPPPPLAEAMSGSPASPPSLRVTTAAPLPPLPKLTALSPERYKLQVTIDEETREVLKQAQDLMRHALPNGDPAVIVARALRLLVDDLLKKKAALTQRPRPAREMTDGSRAIPAAVRREVWSRDRGHCTFEGPRGRCDARSPLEYHHVIPYAMGGQATADNIELRCRAHNAYQASLDGLGWEPLTASESG